jgi:hypothetical protein
VSQSSPILTLSGKYWDGAASQTDAWTIQAVLANGTNGTSSFKITHSGSTNANIDIGNLNFACRSITGGPASSQSLGISAPVVSLPQGLLTFINDVGLSRISAGVLGIGNGTAGDTTGNLQLNQITKYNGEATAGVGASYLRGSTSQKAETGADANVLTVTPAAVAGSYRLRVVLSVSAASAAVIGWTATWTDSNGNAQTPTNLALFQSGAAAPALTFTTSAAGNYYAEAQIDVNNAGTNIVIKATFSGTSVAYKISATIERII